MSSLTNVYVSVNRAAAIRRGINGTDSPVLVSVDVSTLSQEDRDDVAERLRYHGGHAYLGSRYLADYSDTCHVEDVAYKMGNKYRVDLLTVTDPTLAGVQEALASDRARIAAELQRRAEKKAAAHREKIASAMDVLRERRERIDTVGFDRQGVSRYWQSEQYVRVDQRRPYWHEPPAEVAESDEAKAWRAEIDAANARAVSDAIAAKDAEIAAAAKDRAEWIATHGSQRLQRLAVEGIDHDKTYEREREKYEQGLFDAALNVNRPGWYQTTEAEIDRHVADVSARTLALLDAARKTEPSAKLAKRRSDGKYICVAEFRGKLIAWPQESA